MEHRPLGRTGVSVSKFCLGAMMFGAWGNPDHDESIRIIHRALDAGVNFIQGVRDAAHKGGGGAAGECRGRLARITRSWSPRSPRCRRAEGRCGERRWWRLRRSFAL
jgi:predicted aldo/keto reductase-like oxidoreductase